VTGSRVAERPSEGEVPLWVHPDWASRFPWLVQGTTGSGVAGSPFDLGLSGGAPLGETLGRWRRLMDAVRVPGAVHARQVHGGKVFVHGACAPGLLVMDGVDGHLTDRAGLLLTVSVADCVPVFVADAARRAVALLHAGWRGVAAGILEHGLDGMRDAFGSRPADLWIHLGPAVCGNCYEVGPEVHAAVRGVHVAERGPIDLRSALRERALSAGVRAEQCSTSIHCTRCTAAPGAPRRPFFSHRAGDAGRQMATLGVRG
jgi:polyphenol oxidase